MLAAGCAVGLGNVWRFPFIVGQNGGAAFVLVYLLFLVLLGFPLLAAEIALGRASRRGISGAMRELAAERHRRFWAVVGNVIFAGNVLLMVYYTDVAGWLVRSSFDCLRGAVGDISFAALSGDKVSSAAYLVLAVAVSAGICMAGVRNGVERVGIKIVYDLPVYQIVGCQKRTTREKVHGGREEIVGIPDSYDIRIRIILSDYWVDLSHLMSLNHQIL